MISAYLEPHFDELGRMLRANLPLDGFARHNMRMLTSADNSTWVTEYELGQKANSSDADAIWILISGFLVFWMQAGFAMLEAGSVRSKNTTNILFKNIMDVAIAAVSYFLIGFGFAYGTDNADDDTSLFIGTGGYALESDENTMKHIWFFQFAFAATAATIVSGAVAERTALPAYFVYSIFLTVFVYPVVSHWIWSSEGWLSAFGTADCPTDNCAESGAPVSIGGSGHPPFASSYSNACGMIDYAGSGVVHMVGGFAGLVGAIVVGARKDRFEVLPDGSAGALKPIAGHNIALSTTGTLVLWFGWYGFNCGSTLAFDGKIASKVAVTTTLAPAAACLTGVFFTKLTTGVWDLGVGINCILAGLVSITAPCSTVPDFVALFIGMIGAFVYMGASSLLKKLKIDDPLDAFPVHGACGVWGCLSVGIFATKQDIAEAFGTCGAVGTVGNENGYQFATQLVGVLAVMTWTVSLSAIMFLTIKYTIGMRVPAEMEEAGLDTSEHGGAAYNMGGMLPDTSMCKTKPVTTVELSGATAV